MLQAQGNMNNDQQKRAQRMKKAHAEASCALLCDKQSVKFFTICKCTCNDALSINAKALVAL